MPFHRNPVYSRCNRVNWAEATESSWADQVDEADLEETGKDKVLPQPTEKIDGNTKIVTEYKINEDGKKVKVVIVYFKDPSYGFHLSVVKY